MFLPGYFAFDLIPEEGGDLYVWTVNDFGNTIYFKIYILILLVPETLLPVIALTTMIILTSRAYNKRKESQATYMTTSINR